MPTGEERLHLVLHEESEVFTTDCRQLFLDTAAKLGHTPKIEKELIIVTKTDKIDFLELCKTALQTHKVVMLVARASELPKLVSVVEQTKSSAKGRVAQINRIFTQPSLINPGTPTSHSIKNVQIFFGDEIESNPTTQSALKEIKGHKVFEVPCMAVILASGSEILKTAPEGWTLQVKG